MSKLALMSLGLAALLAGGCSQSGRQAPQVLAGAGTAPVVAPTEVAGETTAPVLQLIPAVAREAPAFNMFFRGDPALPTVALTFDDGPHPAYTPRLLRILAQHRVRASFFVVGKMAVRHPELVRAEATAGHLVANHSYSHRDLAALPAAEVGEEWLKCSQVVWQITGQEPRFCRPPGGSCNDRVVQIAAGLGLSTVMWTKDPGDYGAPGVEHIVNVTAGRAQPGAILLLHDGAAQTVEALPQVITVLRRKGFAFQTVEEMARILATNNTRQS